MKPCIIVDSRERRPYLLGNTVRTKLEVGDYSIQGHEDYCAIERKSKSDLFGTYSKRRTQFVQHLADMSKIVRRAVVVECTIKSLRRGPDHYRGKEDVVEYATRVYHALLGWQARYDVPFHFFTSRDEAQEWVAYTLSYWRKLLRAK